MPALNYEKAYPIRAGLADINRAVALGLTTALIGPLTSVAGLQSAITGLTVHRDASNILTRISKTIDYLKAAEILTDANVTSANTVAGLRSIFTTLNSNLDATYLGASIFGS